MVILSKAKKEKGFTLTEVLVIVTIIVILVGIVILSTEDSRKLARDKRRMSDLAGYQVALQEYYSKHKFYNRPPLPASDKCSTWVSGITCTYDPASQGCDCPASDVLSDLKTEGFLENLPKDPINSEDNGLYRYRYVSYNDGKDYKLYVQLEKDKPAMENDGGSEVGLYEVFSTLGSGLAINYWKIVGITGSLSCELCAVSDNSCSSFKTCDASKLKVIKISTPGNAHAEFASKNNYGCAVACSGPQDLKVEEKTAGNSCNYSPNTILKLSSADTNSHVGSESGSSYQNRICFSRTTGQITCNVRDNCSKGEECVATISGNGDTNAHIAGCGVPGAYSKKICCIAR